MDKAKPFDDYFNDPALAPDKLARMKLTRDIVHRLYPHVQERVSYAMPGFYPPNAAGFSPSAKAPNANQQLFLLMANKGWLGIYGTQGLDDAIIAKYEPYGISAGRGSLRVPYDMPVEPFTELLQAVINHNVSRHHG